MKIQYALVAVAFFLVVSPGTSGERNMEQAAPKAPVASPPGAPPLPPPETGSSSGLSQPLPPSPPALKPSEAASIEQLLELAGQARARRVELETRELERTKQVNAQRAELDAQEKALLETIRKKVDKVKERVDSLNNSTPIPSGPYVWRMGLTLRDSH